MGGCLQYRKLPLYFSMGSNTNDLGCYIGKYCKSVEAMQTVTFLVHLMYIEIVLGGDFPKKIHQKES